MTANQSSDQLLGISERSVMVSKSVRNAWKEKVKFDETKFIEIKHMGFAIKEASFWITLEEFKELSLPNNRVLSDSETEEFLGWTEGKTSGILRTDFEAWTNDSQKI